MHDHSNISQKDSEKYSFHCHQCGNCCRQGFEIYLTQEDILLWEGHPEFLICIQIDPKSISESGLAGYHIEDKNAVIELKKRFSEDEFEQKLDELIKFIQKNHDYHGEMLEPFPIYTVLPKMKRRPILVPKSFEAIREGLDKDIAYMLRHNSKGVCPFLKDNICSIHKIKPNECRKFPFDKHDNLRIDDYLMKFCKGISKKRKR